jgi:Fic family protein
MEEYFNFYEENKDTLNPVILSAEIHERLVTIHADLGQKHYKHSR